MSEKVMLLEEKADFYIKTVISWGKIVNREFQLSQREIELIRNAYLAGYEDGKNENRSLNK